MLQKRFHDVGTAPFHRLHAALALAPLGEVNEEFLVKCVCSAPTPSVGI